MSFNDRITSSVYVWMRFVHSFSKDARFQSRKSLATCLFHLASPTLQKKIKYPLRNAVRAHRQKQRVTSYVRVRAERRSPATTRRNYRRSFLSGATAVARSARPAHRVSTRASATKRRTVDEEEAPRSSCTRSERHEGGEACRRVVPNRAATESEPEHPISWVPRGVADSQAPKPRPHRDSPSINSRPSRQRRCYRRLFI